MAMSNTARNSKINLHDMYTVLRGRLGLKNEKINNNKLVIQGKWTGFTTLTGKVDRVY